MSTGPHGVWYLVVLLPLLLFLGWWYYRYTVPTVSPGRRVFLLILRLLGLAGLAVALARPVLNWQTESDHRAEWLALVDYSSSMDRTDGPVGGESRLAAAARMVSDAVWREHSESVDVTVQYYGAGYDADSARVGRAATDLYGTLGEIGRRPDPPTAVLVISDGAVNAAATLDDVELPFPVYSICVGDSGRAEDRALVGIEAPSVATAGDSVRVSVRSRASGEPQSAILTFTDGVREEHRTVQLDGGGREHETVFSFVPDTAGVYKVSANLSTAADEVAVANNQIETRVYVEPRKRKALIMSFTPNWESAFLLRRLQESDRLDVTVAYQTLSGRQGFAEWPRSYDSLAQFDLILITDMTPMRWARMAPMIRRHLEDNAAGLMVMLGPEAATAEWSDPQQQLIKLRFNAQPPGVFTVTSPVFMSGDGRMHPVPSLDTTADAAALVWAGLPLLSGVLPGSVAPDGVILVETSFGVQSWPVVIAGKVGSGRVLTTTGYPLWRWDFAANIGENEISWADRFWQASTRWLTLAHEGELLSVTPLSDPVPALTPPALSALVVDETWKPVRGAVVTAEIMDSTGTVVQTFELSPGQPGRYEGEGRPLPPGEYTYRVQARVDETVMASQEGHLTATSVSREDVFPGSRPDVLDRIAAETGGARLSVDGWQSALAEFPAEREIRLEYGSFRLWESPWLLGCLILLFSVEWILRRRFQML